MKKSHLYPALLAAAMLIITSCHRSGRDEQIAREAREFTEKQCPKMVDEGLRMDSTTFDSRTRAYTYNYTALDNLDNPAIYTDQLKTQFRERLLSELRNSIGMKTYKEAGITIIYRYVSATTGNTLLEYQFTKEEYQ